MQGYLPNMVAEMLHHMQHDRYARFGKTLNPVLLFQPMLIQIIDDHFRLLHRAVQVTEQSHPIHRTSLIEFGLPLPSILGISQRSHDPLAHIPGKVKHQVAHAHHIGIRPVPDVLVGHHADAFVYAAEAFIQAADRFLFEEVACIHGWKLMFMNVRANSCQVAAALSSPRECEGSPLRDPLLGRGAGCEAAGFPATPLTQIGRWR